uniref:Uncharacterized protein n=1 Tax=Hyaloperonospora arabidopsidis (strain Emoy2) TaxID=559515 RepID=M4C6Z6_HYAAE
MRQLVVEVAVSGTASSIARVSPTTFKCLGATWGSYVSLQCSDVHDRARVFRLEVDTLIQADDRILIDHWPKCDTRSETSCKCTSTLTTGSLVHVTCVTPADIQVAQVLTLAPVTGDKQLKLALPFVQSLLQRRVLMDRCGSIALQWDGVDYGAWTFEAFFPGRSRDRDNYQVLTGFDGGIVTDQTLVLMFPSVMSSVAERLHGSKRYYPIGAHSRTCQELVAMALRQTSSCGADEAT